MNTDNNTRYSGKRERTRQAILHAAMNIIATKGLAGTSIDELMSHTGMARGTFYNYFQTREEVLDAVVEDLRMHLHEHIEQHIPAGTSAAATIACMMYGIQQYAMDHPCLGWIIVRLSHDNDFFKPPEFDDHYFKRTNNAIMDSTKRDVPFLTAHTYIQGIGVNITRGLLLNYIDMANAEQIMVMVLRGIGIEESQIDNAIDQAREFAQLIHERYKDWQCPEKTSET